MKRLFDFTIALVLVTLLFPVLLIVALMVRLKLGTPILFVQMRPGLKARPFLLYKFRSMTDATGADGQLLPDGQRLTAFGKLLRSTSLDELPSLWNVLKGDMSLVGPRPLLTEYLPLYNQEQARRHNVRPGITGLAQINGRNALSWEEKLKLDIYYVDNYSFRLDLKILLMTTKKVILREGISAAGEATTSKFTGQK